MLPEWHSRQFFTSTGRIFFSKNATCSFVGAEPGSAEMAEPVMASGIRVATANLRRDRDRDNRIVQSSKAWKVARAPAAGHDSNVERLTDYIPEGNRR